MLASWVLETAFWYSGAMPTARTPGANPHDYDHKHSDVSGGWLRASVFGAMDGLVSNIGLIAGIAGAGASSGIVVLTGIAGLTAGAISMALGEFTSVRTQNEQLSRELATETSAQQRNPEGEQAELVSFFERLGMTNDTATEAASQVHVNSESAVKFHLTHELGLSPDDQASPWTAAWSSLFLFAAGALIPLLPYLLGFGSLTWALVFGGAGLLLAGGLATFFTPHPWWYGAGRQLLFGSIAVGVTYFIGRLLGVDVA